MKREVYFIKKTNKSEYIMFMKNSLKFYTIDENGKDVITKLLAGYSDDKIKQIYNIDMNKLKSLKALTCDESLPIFNMGKIKNIDRLILNITNKCNLDCKYCYASGGNYGSSEGIMTIETAKRAIDLFLSQYENIYSIQFFGGEPLLNLDVIEFVCDYFEKKFYNNEISVIPQFGTITNGTIFSKRLTHLINKYKISITVSIDGPSVVHDKMRVFSDDSGSLVKILNNIKKLRTQTPQPVAIEVTYNAAHENNNMSILDTVKYLKDTIGVSNIHIAPVSSEGNECTWGLENLKAFTDSIDDIFSQLKIGENYTFMSMNRVIRALKIKKVNKYHCFAGVSIFSVSHTGDLYPCSMFIDVLKFKMGNIYNKNLFNDEVFLALHDHLVNFNKFETTECVNCINSTLCSGCLGYNFFNTNKIYKPSQEHCDMQRTMMKKVLIGLSEL